MFSSQRHLVKIWFQFLLLLRFRIELDTRDSNAYVSRAKRTQPETRKLQQVCCRLAASCDHQADIRMPLHRLLRLDDNKSAASCQQACCKLRTADLLQVANCRLAASCELQACCKLSLSYLLQIVKTTCSKPAVDMATMDIREHATRGFRICLRPFSTRRNFARGATFSVRLIKKLNCFQLCYCTILAESVAPRAKFRLVENRL